MADIKRFAERWRTDKDFRDTYPCDPEKAGRKAKLRVDSEIVRPIWDNCELYRDQTKIPPALQRFDAFERGSVVTKYEGQRPVAKDARFESWRKRQVHRVGLEVGVSTVANPHIAASLELSRGCSVGCWFCSVSPPRLGDVFRYTTENARLWRGILDALWDVLGPAASQSICYSGTDPFDNIDYERFADDFGLAYGTLPYTSTALAVRDVERTRRFMARSEPYQLRFSVLSVGMLDKIHAAFTPEEMLYVRIDPRNAGSLSARQIHFAGRARERADMYRKHVPGDPLISTPSCETGFKFNLPDRVIRLSSPCAPDERWPNGYRVYAERNFTDADDARRIMLDMIAEHMPTELPHNAPVAWHHMLRFEPTAEGFKLVGPHLTQRFNNSNERPFFRNLGELITMGRHDAESLATVVASDCKVTSGAVRSTLNELFHLGVLDDAPPARH